MPARKSIAAKVTLYDADMRQLWQGMTWYSGPSSLSETILPWIGRDNLQLLLKVAAVAIVLKCGTIEWMDDVDLDVCLASWRITVAKPEMLDWSFKVRKPTW